MSLTGTLEESAHTRGWALLYTLKAAGADGAADAGKAASGTTVAAAMAATARPRGRRAPSFIRVLLCFDWRSRLRRGASTAMRRLSAPGYLALNRRIPAYLR